MDDFITAISTGFAAFTATNIDSHTLENRGLTVLAVALIGLCLMAEARDAFRDSA